MGEYTELNISIRVENNPNVLDILRVMVSDSKDELDISKIPIPAHPFFKSEGWQYMLTGYSMYFDHTDGSSLVNKTPYENDPKNYIFILNVRCDLKDYNDEIENFLDWIYTYSKTEGFIGYKRTDDPYDDGPTLIYFTNEGVIYKHIPGLHVIKY